LATFRYLALGDSYTIGESVSEEERWPNQVSKLLEMEGVQVEPTIIARTGWTVDELWEGIQADPPQGPYDVVTLLIGVNNQYRGYPVTGYREDFRFILGKALEYVGSNPDHLIVLSIPDWGFTPFAVDRDRELVSRQIDEFNAVNFEEAKSAEAHYINITPISRQAMDEPTLIASDGLHPSGKMYAMWAEQVYPVVKDILIRSKEEKP
jgi:lysophospholipase L1-like esterase